MSACDTLVVNETGFDHVGDWTEADYDALDETKTRIELIDGGLLVTPSANSPHNHIASALWRTLYPSAREAGLRASETLNVRLAPGRKVIPDLAVARMPWLTTTADAADVVLVCEVTSPSNAVTDRVLKMHLYAQAGIGWYLLIEPDMTTYETVTLHLFRLEKDEYVEHDTAKHGQTLTSDLPFPFAISTTDLLDP